MANPFNHYKNGVDGPGRDYVPVTPNDSTDLADVATCLYIENAGAVVFDSVKGETRTVNVSDFGWIVCGVKRVRATGTTATGIHAVVVT